MKKSIVCLLAIITITACKKEIADDPTQAAIQEEQEQEIATTADGNNLNKNLIVTTFSVTPGSAIGAFLRGEISGNGGGSSIVENGFCYSTTAGTTISDDTIHANPYFPPDQFFANLTGLIAGTTYYVKAYGMKNNGDIYYGDEKSFTTLTLGLPGPGVGTVTDIDGNIYNTITLGTQVWMIENLKTTRYRDGSSITNITDNENWVTATSGAYSDYDNVPGNSSVYGRLYNLYAMKDSRNIAPAGWHVPNFSEWITLLNYLGGSDVGGGRMKEAGFTHWLSPNTGADNTSGFTALGAGSRNAFSTTGNFASLQSRTNFWSSSSSIGSTSTSINIVFLNHNSASYAMTFGSIGLYGATFGCSIRCVKD